MELKADRFTVLDSWRGICAIIVVIHHFLAAGHFLFLPFFRNSGLFVDFFFVLSGFVITHAYQGKLSTTAACTKFAIRRFGRVWPLHVVMLIPFVATELIKLVLVRHGLSVDRPPFSGPTSLDALGFNFILVQAMGVLPDVTWNTPSWSISVEYWTYILFATVMLASSKTTRSGLWRTIALTGLFAVSLFSLIFYAKTLLTIANLGFARCVYSFIGGHFAYRLWERIPAVKWATAMEFALIFAVMLFVTYAASGYFVFFAPVVFGMSVVVFAQERGALSVLLSRTGFRFIGKLSFSIYMIHLFLFDTFQKVVAVVAAKSGAQITKPIEVMADSKLMHTKVFSFGGPFASDLLLILFVTSVLLISTITYRLIEKPGQRFFNNLARGVPDIEGKMLATDPKSL